MPLPPPALSPLTPPPPKRERESGPFRETGGYYIGAEHVYNVPGVTCQTRMQEAGKDYSFLLKVLRREQEESIIGQKKAGGGRDLNFEKSNNYDELKHIRYFKSMSSQLSVLWLLREQQLHILETSK